MPSAPAIAHREVGAYSILFAPVALQVFARLSLVVRGTIRQRLNEIAIIAGTLASQVVDDVQSQLRFTTTGHVVAYAVSDRRQVLTVLSIDPAPAGQSR